MPKKDRTSIDYMPGQVAFHALGLASEMFPTLRPQALIDKLVITGLVALQWKRPDPLSIARLADIPQYQLTNQWTERLNDARGYCKSVPEHLDRC